MALLLAPAPLLVEAKAPGVAHCYRSVCHRVLTIAETRRLVGRTQKVETSYYDVPGVDRFNAGIYTSNGERFDAGDPARVASADLPDGTELLLRNPVNGRVSHVRVNDFGPFRGNRRLDVTRRVAEDLDFRHKGVVKLDVIVIAPPGEADLSYRRNRPRQATQGHLGVVFDHEMPALVARLLGVPDTATVASAVPQPDAGGTAPRSAAEATGPTVPEFAEPVVTLAAQVNADSEFQEAQHASLDAQTETGRAVSEDGPYAARASAASDVLLAVTAAHNVSGGSVQAEDTTTAAPAVVTAVIDATDVQGRADTDAGWLSSTVQAASILARSPATDRADTRIPYSGQLLLTLIAALCASLLLMARRATPIGAPGLLADPSSRRATRSLQRPEAAALAPHVADPTSRPASVEVASHTPDPAAVQPLAGAFVDADLAIEGRLRSRGRLSIAGLVKGGVEADEVVVLPGGRVEGEIVCRAAWIGGTFIGRLVAQDVGIGTEGAVDGEVTSVTIAVAMGGRLDADVKHRR